MSAFLPFRLKLEYRVELAGPVWTAWAVGTNWFGAGETVFDFLSTYYAHEYSVLSSEYRFTLGVPVACTVIYKIGERNIGDPTYTYGADQQQIVNTTPVVITLPGTAGKEKEFQVIGIRAHPWT